MVGRVFDLSLPATPLPPRIIVDTNVLYERMRASRSTPASIPTLREAQVAALLTQIRRERSLALVPPTVVNELVHTEIRLHLTAVGQSRRPPQSWRQVYKLDPTVLGTLRADLIIMRQLMVSSGLRFVSPDDLAPIGFGISYEQRLIETCCRYGLDTGDAGILVDAQRLGVDAIMTMDADLQRALPEFDIYTWP